MKEIQNQHPPTMPAAQVSKGTDWRRKTLYHYCLAAAMTLLLMSTGVFSQLMNVASTFESKSVEKDTSIVDGLLNKTVSITDKIENNFKEGDTNE